jgi:hypothetical protein
MTVRLVIGADHAGFGLARELPCAVLSAHFTGEERHRRRLSKLGALEARYCVGINDSARDRRSTKRTSADISRPDKAYDR